MNVVIRADASVQIGTGHVMRMLALAQELRVRGGKVRFICRAHEGHLGESVLAAGFELCLLPMPEAAPRVAAATGHPHEHWLGVDWETDARDSLRAMKGLGATWLIVDHYGLDIRWERALRASGAALMVVDDLADRHHDADVLLDQNLGRVESDYDGLLPPSCRRLVGPSFALLRAEFAGKRKESLSRRRSPVLRRVLVTMGGIDAGNMTGRVLRALARAPVPPELAVDVIMGRNSPHIEAVRKQAAGLGMAVEVSVGVQDMADRMARSDLIIGAAGSTSWERCCLGVPALAVELADNQKAVLSALAEAGAVDVLDPRRLDEGIAEALAADGLQSRLVGMSRAASAIADGLGAGRVALELVRLDGIGMGQGKRVQKVMRKKSGLPK